MRASRHILFFVLGTAAALGADFDWQIQRFEGRDYLPFDQIAGFYGFSSQFTPVNNRIGLESPKAQLDVAINSSEVIINGVRQWLAFPMREQDGRVFMSRLDLVKTLEPMLRPELIHPMQPVKTIVLDPGHGGHDKGAYSRFGFEKDFALDVARKVRTLLVQRGINVVMTRDSDVFVPLEERARIANRLTNCIFVSIHFNSSMTNMAATGFEVFSLTPRGAPSTGDPTLSTRDMLNEPGNFCDVPSAALAGSVYHSLLGNIPEIDRGLKRARFAVLRLSKVPAILVEGGFLSSSSESQLVASAAWRSKLAEAIVTGLENYKSLAETKQPPKLVAEYRRIHPSGVTLRDAAPAVITNTQPEVVIPKSN